MKDVLQKHAWEYPGLMAGAIAAAQGKERVFPLVDDGALLNHCSVWTRWRFLCWQMRLA